MRHSSAALILLLHLLYGLTASAQLLHKHRTFTRADTLRGMLSPLRSCYDVIYYHLDIRADIEQKFISGSNLIRFTATEDLDRLQFDLFSNLKVEKVIFRDRELRFQREYNAVFVDFDTTIKKDASEEFTVYYSGNPVIAQNPPWDGGFTFIEDEDGKPWAAVSCQGIGASLWWPNKDHQSDEADSMLISVSVPAGLMDVSNGRLRSTEKLQDGYTRYNWFVSYPINNYNVTVNIGDFAHFSDTYQGENGTLDLDYYVLRRNQDKAMAHFARNVKPMLQCFEHWFGPYPFYRDGYKLIETPYLGMEHQSAVAYGNGYQNGYAGTDLSGTGLGLSWDYLIVHESGHEWFGNNITSKDIADMWIHEAFTTYSEGLFVECREGKEAGARYIKGERKAILNDIPVIGPYHVNKEGSGDMYYKGANMLHTIRSVIDNDEIWRGILRGLNTRFGLKTVTTPDITSYISKESGKDLSTVFDQYLLHTSLPVLEIKTNKKRSMLSYRWKADAMGFDMPVKIRLNKSNNDQWFFIYPKQEWQTLEISAGKTDVFVDTENFCIQSRFL